MTMVTNNHIPLAFIFQVRGLQLVRRGQAVQCIDKI